MVAKPCSVEGCGRQAVTRGWCNTHYKRWLAHGDPGTVIRPRRKKDEPCSIEGCRYRAEVRGWCIRHYNRFRNHGDPNIAIRASGVSGKILDILTTDGGWLTAEGIGIQLPEPRPETIGDALRRLQKLGQVERRRVELAINAGHSNWIEWRYEWRAVEDA